MIDIDAIIVAARMDRDGCWKVTLEVPAIQGPKVAALAMHQDKVLSVRFVPQENG